MMSERRLMWRLSCVLALAGSLTLASLSSAGTNDKVTICHFPPGNPANYQTITIGAAALPDHLAHGDFPGSCDNDCNLFGSVCDDGNPCTTDICNPDGTCANPPTNCDDGNVCTTDSCDPVTGDCVNTQICCSYSTSGIRTACDFYRGSAPCQTCLQAQCPGANTACQGAAFTFACSCGSGGNCNSECAAAINQCSQCASACCPG